MKIRSFRFVPQAIATKPSTIIDDKDGDPKLQQLALRLVTLRKEALSELGGRAKMLDPNLRRLLGVFFESDQEAEAEEVEGYYDTIVNKWATEMTREPNLLKYVRQIYQVQRQLEKAMGNRNGDDNDVTNDNNATPRQEREREEHADPTAPVSKKKRRTGATKPKLVPVVVTPKEPTATAEPEPKVAPSAPEPKVLPSPPPPLVVTPAMATEGVVALARGINDVLAQALTPMLSAVGGVAMKLGMLDMRELLAWAPQKPDLPVDRLRIIDEDPATNPVALSSVAEFVRRYEPVLGGTFLRAYLRSMVPTEVARLTKAATPTPMGHDMCFDFERDLHHLFPHPRYDPDEERRIRALPPGPERDTALSLLTTGRNALDLLGLQETEARFAPAWAFSVLSNAVFRAFVQPAGLAAFEMAHSHVQRLSRCRTYTLKELICSSEVSDKFHFLVAYQYMSAHKGLPITKTSSSGSGPSRQYVNVNQRYADLRLHHDMCTVWFENCTRATRNPLLHEFEEYRKKERARLFPGVRMVSDPSEGGPATPQERARYHWEHRMDEYAAALPQRELKYVA